MTLGLLPIPSLRASQASGAGLSQTACSLLIPLPSVTECDVTHRGCSYCACLSGYQWNTSVCSHHRPCQTPSSAGLVAALSSALLKPGTASCCHLVRRVGNVKTNGPE